MPRRCTTAARQGVHSQYVDDISVGLGQALLAATEGPQGAAALLTLTTLAREVAAQLRDRGVAESRASSGGDPRWEAAQAALVPPANPLAPFARIRPLLQACSHPACTPTLRHLLHSCRKETFSFLLTQLCYHTSINDGYTRIVQCRDEHKSVISLCMVAGVGRRCQGSQRGSRSDGGASAAGAGPPQRSAGPQERARLQ